MKQEQEAIKELDAEAEKKELKEQEEEQAKLKMVQEATQKLSVVSEIPLEITCVLGSASMTVNQMIKLSKGSVIELDRNVGEPIDILVNGKLVAKGEIVIIDEHVGITLTELTKDPKNG